MILPALLLAALCPGDGEMTPGVHKNIPCDGNPKWSWNVYIPKAYAEESERKFPVMWCSTSGESASFWKLEKWAEENDFLLVSFNNTKNGMTFPEIGKVQDGVIATAEAKLRLHPCLRFSTGSSGGAAMSMWLASRYPDKHAGVIMQIHGIEFPIPKHISVSFICGGKDKKYPASSIRSSYTNLKNRGNPVRLLVVPDRGHDSAKLEELITDLEWMYNWQRLTHPNLSREDKMAVMKEIGGRAEACPKIEDPGERLAETETLLGLPSVERMKDYKTILQAWFSAKADLAAFKSPAEEHEDLFFLMEDPRSRGIPGAEVSKARKRLEELRKEQEIKKEYVALKMYLQAKRMEDAAGANITRRKNAREIYAAIVKKYPDTRAAKRASGRLGE